MDYAWDPRCRPWYMDAVKSKSKNVLLSDPYLGNPGDLAVYITFTKYSPVQNGLHDSVLAVDLSTGWEVYREIMNGQKILSHYFLVDLKGQVILHSDINAENFNEIYNISRVEFNIGPDGKIPTDSDVCND